MDRIVLEVNETVGKMYRALSSESKQQFAETVGVYLVKKADRGVTNEEFMKLLDEVGNEAVKNGLTEEILEKLLASDD